MKWAGHSPELHSFRETPTVIYSVETLKDGVWVHHSDYEDHNSSTRFSKKLRRTGIKARAVMTVKDGDEIVNSIFEVPVYKSKTIV